MGHLVKVSNKILGSKDPVIEKSVRGNAAWNEYVDTKLREINIKYDTQLGGKDPRVVLEDIASPNVKLELPVTRLFEIVV